MIRNSIPLLVATAVVLYGSFAFGQGGFVEADANGDEKLNASEMQAYVKGKLDGFDQFEQLFKALDRDQNAFLSAEEFENRMTAVQKLLQDKSEADKETTPRRAANDRKSAALKVGDVAPTFKLKSLDGKSETDLESFAGKKPVVLIFGSYT